MRQLLDSVGATLSAARLGAGLTLEDCERQSGIRTRYLEELERGGCEVPADVYRRQCLKHYASSLGLNWQPLWQQYQQEKSWCSQQPRFDFSVPKEVNAKWGHRWGRYAMVLTVFVVAAGYLTFSTVSVVALPLLEIDSPADQLVALESVIPITGRSSPEATVYVNGREVRSRKLNGEFSDQVSLHPGLNTITITAVKKVVRQTSIERHVFVPADTAGSVSQTTIESSRL